MRRERNSNHKPQPVTAEMIERISIFKTAKPNDLYAQASRQAGASTHTLRKGGQSEMDKEEMISVTLSNGMTVRIPVKDWKERVEKMEERIKESSLNNKKSGEYK